MKYAYAVGDEIEARDPVGATWHPATVMKLEPYRGRPGYYIHWKYKPGECEPWMSAGGWTYEACMRPRCIHCRDGRAHAQCQTFEQAHGGRV